jgi:hypothetical protein
MFLFAVNLTLMDLDIFAGLLLLIESVVVLMLFFLIIYLAPNVQPNNKINNLKTYAMSIFIIFLLSKYSYPTLGMLYFESFSIPIYFYDDYYEALNDISINDLTGLFVGLYITNSLLLVIIGLFLLVASIICVVLVSFFTKIRNASVKDFLNLFNLVKNCYSFIFLRKQNLAKQGRAHTSTRVFSKKTFDSAAHKEYREKYEKFEQQKKEQQKKEQQKNEQQKNEQQKNEQ